MTLLGLLSALDTTGLPIAYMAFTEDSVPPMPFLTYQETGSDNFGADNRVWVSGKRIQIDLFSARERDFDTEATVEAALDSAGIYWDRESDYDDDNVCHRTTYTVTI